MTHIQTSKWPKIRESTSPEVASGGVLYVIERRERGLNELVDVYREFESQLVVCHLHRDYDRQMIRK